MTEFTLEEWESRKITWGGFVVALWDVFLMGSALLAGYCGIVLRSRS